jgi:LmbE family N-acetylglucosaminyl deacetylase
VRTTVRMRVPGIRVRIVITVVLLLMLATPALITTFTLIVPAAGLHVPLAAVRAEGCTERSLQIVAHPDDDLLFQNPDIFRDIQAGHCVQTVFLTAGDAGRGETYWRSREVGIQAAYAVMAGADDIWIASDPLVNGQPIHLAVLDEVPTVSVVFLRIPDGNRDGRGMAVNHHESLRRLWEGDLELVTTLDGSARYTRESLTAALTEIMRQAQADTVRTQDWELGFDAGDSADHVATALFAHAAHQDYGRPHRLLGYAGYPVWILAANVTGSDLAAKAGALAAYARHDPHFCFSPWCAEAVMTSLRAARQYVVSTVEAPGR